MAKMELRGTAHDNTVPNPKYVEHSTSIWNRLNERSKEVIRQARKN